MELIAPGIYVDGDGQFHVAAGDLLPEWDLDKVVETLRTHIVKTAIARQYLLPLVIRRRLCPASFERQPEPEKVLDFPFHR